MNSEAITKVVVIGAGTMGEGIAHSFAQAGLLVRLVEQDENVLERCLAQINANLELFAEHGLLQEQPPIVMERINSFSSQRLSEATEDCDFVVEAIPEILEPKKELFAQLDELRTEVILSSNTSTFPISTITSEMRTPTRVVGLHYFYPAHIIPLVEIHRGQHTEDAVVKVASDLMLRVNKKPVLIRKEVLGFLVNRITGAIRREIDYILDEGIGTVEDIDTAIKASIGFRYACLGPMELEDMQGLDMTLRAAKRVFKDLSNATEPSTIHAEKVRKGELGIKTGKGWKDYSGRSRREVLGEINRKLLQQLALFNARDQ